MTAAIVAILDSLWKALAQEHREVDRRGGAAIGDYALQQALNRDAIIALLAKIGPAIVLTHSQSGAFG